MCETVTYEEGYWTICHVDHPAEADHSPFPP
jgi:hypothetical protein